MAQHGDHDDTLPKGWPFEVAGFLFVVAMLYFCAHFALHDQGTEIPLSSVFWPLIIGSIAMILFGAGMNHRLDRRRHHR
jgi:hypothetical protein